MLTAALAALILTIGGLALTALRGLSERMDGMESRLADMDRCLARLEGLLEGLGISGRAAPAPASGN